MKIPGLNGVLFLVLSMAGPAALPAQAQADGCSLVKSTYVCNWQAFRARFARVRTVGIEPRPMERVTERRLRELVLALGKNVAAPEQTPDVIFRMLPGTETGIAIGPADQPLAKLEVLAPGVDGAPPTLLWVETFVGQADRPWPMVVTATANQFQARFQHGGR